METHGDSWRLVGFVELVEFVGLVALVEFVGLLEFVEFAYTKGPVPNSAAWL